jgi:hypothetical protein
MSRIKYTDYRGAQGQVAVVDGEIVPVTSEVLSALAHNAMLLASGNAEENLKEVAMQETGQTAKTRIFTHDITLVGLKHRNIREARRQLANRLPVRVTLVREQENRFDVNAIRVEIPGMKHAYIGAESAAVLAPHMDEGTLVFKSATLTSLDADNDWMTGTMTVQFKDRRKRA